MPISSREEEEATSPRRRLDPFGVIDQVIAARYRITKCIGRGGMGVVYLAQQEALDREIVVKVVRDAPDEESSSRFQREARSLSRLSHPNIVQVYDHGRDAASGLLFIAMEYVSGITLARYLKQRVRLNVGEFRSIADQILAGVAEAHRFQLIHRDLKPSNVMLTSNDGETLRVKLLDFGLSKVTGAEPLTQVNQMLGSAMYMAPEQLKGKPVDARADVYALGVLFYQMLTGARPYTGEDTYQVFAQQVGGRYVPMIEALPAGHDVPTALIELVERCMSVDADRRPPDARALLLALNASLGALPTTARHAAFIAAGIRESPMTYDHSTLRSGDAPSAIRSMSTQRQSRVGIVAGLVLGGVGLSALLVVVALLLVVVVADLSGIRAGPTVEAPPAGAAAGDAAAADALRARALQAMSAGDYERSVAFLAEAITLAPASGDLKELLP
ncbi:MAG: serine/threonine-protein kinase, partial [Myxococcota bacterium]